MKRAPVLIVAIALLVLGSRSEAQRTWRASVDSSGAEGQGSYGRYSSMSQDGRFVVFDSISELAQWQDRNGDIDIYLRDRRDSTTTLISSDSQGYAVGGSRSPRISADGQWVAFQSNSPLLVPGDGNGWPDVFVLDRSTGAMTRVSVTSAGGEADLSSKAPSLSADGRFVAFESEATNLVPGDTNGTTDIFVHDRSTGTTTRVSVDSAGNEADEHCTDASISADGMLIAFVSRAASLVPGDTNASHDVFLHDRATARTRRVSVDSAGMQGNSSSLNAWLSTDGRRVAFASHADDLVPGDTNGTYDVFVHELATGITSRHSLDSAGAEGDGWSDFPVLSADASTLAFHSMAANLVAGDTNDQWDIFVRDLAAGTTRRVSVDAFGAQADELSFQAAICPDGSCVSFMSLATLVPDDTNGRYDIYVHGPALTLEVDPGPFMAGSTLDMGLWPGRAGGRGLLALQAIDGVPMNAFLRLGRFDGAGALAFSELVPPGLGGSTWTFVGMGVDPWGAVQISEPKVVRFQ